MDNSSSSGNLRYLLLVEPDANALNPIREALTKAHFVVRTASSGWDALKRLSAGPVDLVVSELNLSDMDASTLREKCIVKPQLRDIPFLFILDEGQSDQEIRALRSGVDDCIAKPFDPAVLVARIQAVVHRRESYERMVRIDPLTRLLNRPSLEAEVNREIDRLSRYHRDASMVLIDIDGFEELNERTNYALGDLLLTCLAGLILSQIRAIDIAGRYHGEKFLLFLPETGQEGAITFTRRIQSQLCDISQKVAQEELTFSAGIVTCTANCGKFSQLAERAEAAMNVSEEKEPGTFTVWQEGMATEN